MSLALSISVLSVSVLQLVNEPQFLNIRPLFLSYTRLAAASSSAPVIVILLLKSMFASL